MTKETFTDLVLESEKTMYRVALSILKNEIDCEDAVQTAILTAYEKLSTLRNETYFKTWLIRILINACNKQLRHRSRHSDLTEDIESNVNNVECLEIREALDKLPIKYRQVIVLYYIEEFSVKEIKEILRIPEGTVKSRLSKGRDLLRLTLE